MTFEVWEFETTSVILWHTLELGPGGAISTKKCPISNPGGKILTKNVLFTSLQPRGQNFNQLCPIYNTGRTILTKNVILPTTEV